MTHGPGKDGQPLAKGEKGSGAETPDSRPQGPAPGKPQSRDGGGRSEIGPQERRRIQKAPEQSRPATIISRNTFHIFQNPGRLRTSVPAGKAVPAARRSPLTECRLAPPPCTAPWRCPG